MAETSSQDDFEQKLAELGYPNTDFSSLESATAPQASMPAAGTPPPAPQDTSDMDALDATRLQAAQAQNPQEVATPSTSDMDALDAIRLQAAQAPQTAYAPDNGPNASVQPPAGYDGSPEANPNIPVPPAPGEGASNATPPPQQPVPSAPAPSPGQLSNAVNQILSSSQTSGQQGTNPLEANPELNDAAIKAAQQKANTGALIANLGNVGSTISAIAAGAKPDDVYFENLAKQAQIPVEQIMQRRDALMKNMTLAQQMLNYQATQLNAQQLQQATDPNSAVSKGARGLVLQFEPKLANIPEFNQMSAQDVKEFADHFLETEARVEGQKAQREFAQQYKQQAIDQRQTTQDNKDFINFGNKIEGGIASSRAAFGKNANVIRQADSAQQLLNQIQTQPGGADQRQYFELARTLDNMLSQGSGTISGTKELLPNTAGKKFASVEEFLSNNPQPAALGQFVNRMQDTINRERNYAIQNNANTISRIAPGYSHLKDKDTSRWNSILNAHGIQTDDSGNITGYNPGAQGQPLTPSTPTTATAQPGQTNQATPTGDTTIVKTSDGRTWHIPTANLDKARQRDPNLQVIQ